MIFYIEFYRKRNQDKFIADSILGEGVWFNRFFFVPGFASGGGGGGECSGVLNSHKKVARAIHIQLGAEKNHQAMKFLKINCVKFLISIQILREFF